MVGCEVVGCEAVRVWVVRWWVVRWWVRVLLAGAVVVIGVVGIVDPAVAGQRGEGGRRETDIIICISCTKSDNTMFSCTDVYRSYKFCSTTLVLLY